MKKKRMVSTRYDPDVFAAVQAVRIEMIRTGGNPSFSKTVNDILRKALHLTEEEKR